MATTEKASNSGATGANGPKDKTERSSRATSAGNGAAPIAGKKTDYKPTPHEMAAAQRLMERRKRDGNTTKFKVTVEDGHTTIEADHPDPASAYTVLADALCTGDLTWVDGFVYQVANAARNGKELMARDLNFMLSGIKAISPRDPTEALLATQMMTVHNAMMVAARRLNHVETIPQQDSASNMFNKLARTFAAQIEALKRYRASGEQKVTVHHQHVNVSANQAVVGVQQGGGGTNEKGSQSHAPGAAPGATPSDAGRPALLGHQQTFGMPLSGASREGPEGVPDAWRAGGSAKG
jgi:hypothetical protein